MKTLTKTLLALFTVLSFQHIACAATAEITWTDYKKYHDIKEGNENRTVFRERIFNTFEQHFTKLAKHLPEGQVLKINVTDVDLAGDTIEGGMERIRIIKDIYFPRMKFSYQLINADGTEVASADVKLKDMNFMRGVGVKYRNDSLGYEKKMLDDWFATFKESLMAR